MKALPFVNKLKRSLLCGLLMAGLPAAPLAAQKPVIASRVATVIAPQVVAERVFHSNALARDMQYSIVLPKGYAQNNRRYPVLYLLHGLHGDHRSWVARTNLARYAEPLDLIIVMPDAGDSWYTDSATNSHDRFEEYIARDLPAVIDATYRTIPLREGRFAAGLSMGGYAAMKLALKYPQQFSLVASLSGAFNAPTDLDRTEEYRAKLVEVFGPADSQTRTDNDLYQLAGKSDPARLPYLFLTCGTGDQFLSANRDFVALLQKQKVPYEYHEMPGKHEWKYWDTHVQDVIALLADRLAREQVLTPIHR